MLSPLKLDFVEKMIAYSNALMVACTRESETAVTQVGQVLDHIMADATRVSKMSADALASLRAVQEDLASSDGGERRRDLSALASALTRLGDEHSEMNGFVMPIVESLQFQDRVRQQMENLGKMMALWVQERTAPHGTGATAGSAQDPSERLASFGDRLMKVTTTDEERDVIRAHIAGIPEAPSVSGDDGFFF